VDANYVYWSSNGLQRLPLDGGTLTQLAAGVENDPIAVGPMGIYGTDLNDDLVAVPLGGGSAATLSEGPGDSNTYGVAVDSKHIYWTDFRGQGAVSMFTFDGGKITQLAVGHAADGIAADGLNAYWVDARGVMKVALAGGSPITRHDSRNGAIRPLWSNRSRAKTIAAT
jgi:hypothetical protein